MLYINLQNCKPEAFKRLVGASPTVFDVMVEVLRANIRVFGRPPVLTLEDRLLMVLMYWREYRTYAHIGMTYGVSEATVCRTVQQFEAILIKDKRFHLPGKKALRDPQTHFEVILMDATECPCERPKKNSVATIRARKSVTHRSRR